MKSLHILTIVSALLVVFGMPSPSARAEDKPITVFYPFRLLFNAYDGNPKKVAPEKMSFVVDTMDFKQPAEFIKLGDRISKTKWKLAKFEFLTRPNPTAARLEDVSELTVVNTETKQEVVLIFNRVTDLAAPVPDK